MEFGRQASDRRDREGREARERFQFLGFTHSCGKTRKNKRFVLLRRTSGKRLGYHAVPENYTRLDQFVTEVTKLWLHQLRRRSQKGRAARPWERMNRLVERYLPQPKILHPYPKTLAFALD